MESPTFKILKASAGSGKTYTLVVEYLKLTLLTEDPTVFRRINAMTFTNKASLEMKERILEALQTLSAQPNSEHYDQQFLDKKSEELGIPNALIQERANQVLNTILHHYGEFNIQTLDSFTSRVVRAFANDVAVSQDFEIEIETDSLVTSVVERLMEAIGSDKEITNLLQEYNESYTEDEKNWDISNDLLEFMKAIAKEDVARELAKFEEISPAQIAEVRKNTRSFVKAFREEVKRIAQGGLDAFFASGFDRNLLSNKGPVLKILEKAIEKTHELPFGKQDYTVVHGGGSWFKKGVDYDISAFQDEVENAYRQLEKLYEDKFQLFKLNLIVQQNILNISLLKKVREVYESLKQEMNLVPIADFNQMIQDLIENEPAPFIFERLGNRFQHYLLDEFQDTSILQWKNLIPLVENGLSAGHFSLIVGDAKQAIYRWRNGEVDQFIELPKLYNPENNQLTHHRSAFFEDVGETDVLKYNFRSKKEIVDFNNQLFERLSSLLSENYRKVYEVNSLKQIPADEQGGGYVEVLPYESELPDEYVINAIESSLKDGFDLRDICVITRGNKTGEVISNQLIQAGYKIASTQLLLVSSDNSVQFLTSLFEYLLNPNDESVKRVLAEKFLQLKESEKDDLYFFNQFSEEFIEGNYKRKVFHLDTFFEHFDINLQEVHCKYESLFELGQKLVRLFDFSLNTNAYLQLVLEFLFQFDQRPNATLFNFVNWYNEKGYKKSIQISENENAIKIMTIHKSKGLQFPVVICPELKDKLQVGTSTTMIPMTEFQPDLPAVLTNKNAKLLKGTKYEYVAENELEKVELDFINMVYVAFTRAINRLYVAIDTKDAGGSKINKALDFLDEDSDLLHFGQKEIYQQKKKSDPAIGLNKVEDTLWFPDISFKSDDLEERESFDKVEFGKAMHLFLSELPNEMEQDKLIKNLVLDGKIAQKYAVKILKQTKQLFEIEEIRDLILAKGKSEQDILIPTAISEGNGNTIRPDKLIFEGNEVKIVDFKTGKPNKKHDFQMQTYKSTLAKMGFSTSSFLIYTDLLKLVKI